MPKKQVPSSLAALAECVKLIAKIEAAHAKPEDPEQGEKRMIIAMMRKRAKALGLTLKEYCALRKEERAREAHLKHGFFTRDVPVRTVRTKPLDERPGSMPATFAYEPPVARKVKRTCKDRLRAAPRTSPDGGYEERIRAKGGRIEYDDALKRKPRAVYGHTKEARIIREAEAAHRALNERKSIRRAGPGVDVVAIRRELKQITGG